MGPEQRKWRARLGDLMEERRVDLGMLWTDVADQSGLTTETLRTIRTGSGGIRSLTKRGIETALQWEPGSIDAILRGGAPVEVTRVAPDSVAPSALTAHARAGLGVAVTTKATAEVIRAAAPRWLASELDRRGVDADATAATVQKLREVAEHYGYTLAELLLDAGLVAEEDLAISERPTPRVREALAGYDEGITRVTSSPFLTDRQRRKLEASTAQDRQDAIEEHLRDR